LGAKVLSVKAKNFDLNIECEVLLFVIGNVNNFDSQEVVLETDLLLVHLKKIKTSEKMNCGVEWSDDRKAYLATDCGYN